MGYKIVPQASSPCVVFPHLGTRQAEGYFETESWIDPPAGLEGRGLERRVNVSVVAVKEYARHLKWISPDEAQEQRQHIASLVREAGDLRAELAEVQRKLDAIDVIESADFRARRKPGRAKKVEAV